MSFLGGSFVVLALAVSLASPVSAEDASSPSPRYLGNDDCRSCHDRGSAAIQFGNHIPAYYVWSQEEIADRIDAHHRAFLDLIPDESENPSSGRLSRHIADLMGLPLHRAEGQPWSEVALGWEKCVRCHLPQVAPEEIAPHQGSGRPYDPVEDNIGCEACHGPAEKYRDTHYVLAQGETREQRRARNVKAGMNDLEDLPTRARLCLGCHSGLDHEIIAAGHPDVGFEFHDFSLRQPPHWDPREASPLEYWAVGLSVAMEDSFKVLAEEANLHQPLPVFDSPECFSCHHKLSQDRWREVEGRLPVYLPLLDRLGLSEEKQRLESATERARQAISSADPKARETLRLSALEAAGAAENLVSRVAELSRRHREDEALASALRSDLVRPIQAQGRRLAPEIPSAWVIRHFDQAQQIYWALHALAYDFPAWKGTAGASASPSLEPVNRSLDEAWRGGIGFRSIEARRQRFSLERFNQAVQDIGTGMEAVR